MPTAKPYLNHPYEEQTAEQKAAKSEKVLRKEEVPIDLMFSVNRNVRFTVATGERIQPKYWDFKEKKAKKSYTGSIELNLSLDKIKTEVLELWRANRDKPMHQLKPLIIEIVRGKSSTSEKKRIFEALDKFLNQYKSEKADKTIGKYATLQARLIEFDKIYPIDFDNLDFNFHDSFKKFLYSIPNPNYIGSSLYRGNSSGDRDIYYIAYGDDRGIPISLFDDTVYKYLVNLKTFLRWAEKRGHQVHPSYKTWNIVKTKHKVITLTIEELERLEVTPMSKPHLSIARDYLVVESRTGQRISDLKKLRPGDIKDREWTHQPKKGNRISSKMVTVHFYGFCETAYDILEKHNFSLPKISEQKLNKAIKAACKEAGINEIIHTDRTMGGKMVRFQGPKHEFLSTHSGRRTFITLALESGMPHDYVMDLAGIDTYQTLDHYKGKFSKAMTKDWLKKMKTDVKPVMRKAE